MCIACRTMQPKKNLIRVVKNNEGQIFVDKTFKANGRGAYLCNSVACIEKAAKLKALNRAYKCEVSDEIIETIKNQIAKN